MKGVLDLTVAIQRENYFNYQFSQSGTEKNILFVSPQLTSKHLYKYILPFFSFHNAKIMKAERMTAYDFKIEKGQDDGSMEDEGGYKVIQGDGSETWFPDMVFDKYYRILEDDEMTAWQTDFVSKNPHIAFCVVSKIRTAITELTKYNPYEQIVRISTKLTASEIHWADFIVFPFTTHDLSKEYDLYGAIRETNPDAKIVFFVDFNFYEILEGHPYYDLFKNEEVINQTERNIINADLVITNNIELHKFIIEKITELCDTKYADIEDVPVSFGCLPYLIDEEVVTQNKEVDFELNTPSPVINKEMFIKVAEVAEETKKEDLRKNKDKANRLKDVKPAPKKVNTKTKKVVAKEVKPKKSKGDFVAPLEEENVVAKLPKNYKIGIICSPTNYRDIQSYNSEFRKINEMYGEQVSLIFIGYDYEEDKAKILDGVNFEYVKQVSIIHFFKQLSGLGLDAVFIPVENNRFNATSENSNKYLECSIFNIPIIAPNIFPYNRMILNGANGFMFSDKQNFNKFLDDVLRNEPKMIEAGKMAHDDVIKNYTFPEKNIEQWSGDFKDNCTYAIQDESGKYLFKSDKFYFDNAKENEVTFCRWSSKFNINKFIYDAQFPFPVYIKKIQL